MTFTLKPGVPPVALTPEADAYLNSLRPGERVIDVGESCQRGLTLSANWGKDAGKTMGTSLTHGTRRESDVEVSP